MNLYEITTPGLSLEKYYKISQTEKQPKIEDFNKSDVIVYNSKLYYLDLTLEIKIIDCKLELSSSEEINNYLETIELNLYNKRTFMILHKLIRNLRTSYHEAVYSYYKYNQCSKIDIIEYTNYVKELQSEEKKKMKPFDAQDIMSGIDYRLYDQAQNNKVNQILWDEGVVPISIKRHEEFIYSKMFIFSLDNIYKFVSVLDKEFPEKGINSIRTSIDKEFPDLINLRNSIHHLEDRIRGIGQKNKIIAYDLNSHSSSSGVINICTSGDLFITTLGDGTIGTLSISPETITHFKGYIEKVFSLFKWKGSPRTDPVN